LNEITLTAHVSKGTYIRSLARDIAHALGTVGHVTMLRRTKAGPFTLDRRFRWTNSTKVGKGARLKTLSCRGGRAGRHPGSRSSPEQARAVKQGRVLTGVAPRTTGYTGRESGTKFPLRW
jgi:tRNA pseudouridine55 synthase